MCIRDSTLTTSSDVLIKPPTADYSPKDPTVINWTLQDDRWRDAGGSYVNTDLESLEDSFQVENRRRDEEPRNREEAWQRNGTYNRGAKFSQSNDRDSSNDRNYKYDRSADGDADRATDAADNPDQPKWRPVR